MIIWVYENWKAGWLMEGLDKNVWARLVEGWEYHGVCFSQA
jgi:hypothetical protein